MQSETEIRERIRLEATQQSSFPGSSYRSSTSRTHAPLQDEYDGLTQQMGDLSMQRQRQQRGTDPKRRDTDQLQLQHDIAQQLQHDEDRR